MINNNLQTEGQTIQWPKDKGQKDKQNTTQKTTDRATSLKPVVNSSDPKW